MYNKDAETRFFRIVISIPILFRMNCADGLHPQVLVQIFAGEILEICIFTLAMHILSFWILDPCRSHAENAFRF